MSILFSSSSESTVAFCAKRLDPKLAQEEMAKHEADCLSVGNCGPYMVHLNQSNYNPALGAIWKDKANALDFVKSYTNDLHAPLMFEAVILEFEDNPTAETVREVCLPLLAAAMFRVTQDAKCVADTSVSDGNAAFRMFHTYYTSLKNRVEEDIQNPSSELYDIYCCWDDLVNENRESIAAESHKKLLSIAVASRTIELPSPAWIGQDADDMILKLGYNYQIMHPSSEHERLRNAYAMHIEQLWKNP